MLLTGLALARAHWKLIGLGLLCLALAVQTVRLGAAENREERAKINLNECRQARKDDRAAYEKAQREAEAKNQAEVAKRESEQEQINEDVVSDLERDLARLHDELRRQAAKGNSGKPGVSQAPASPQGAAPATGLCLSPSEHVRAAENELRHDALIDWAERVEKWWTEQNSPDRSR